MRGEQHRCCDSHCWDSEQMRAIEEPVSDQLITVEVESGNEAPFSCTSILIHLPKANERRDWVSEVRRFRLLESVE